MVPRTCLFIFDAGSCRLGSNNFRNSSYKEKTGSDYDKINELSNFKCNLVSCFNKLRDTADGLGSK